MFTTLLEVPLPFTNILALLQTTGKTLEEIDLIFAKPEVRDSALAARMIHDRSKDVVANKGEFVEYVEKERV